MSWEGGWGWRVLLPLVQIKLYISMSQSEEGDAQVMHLEELLNRLKPKSRYISESHVEEETSSISKEIVNGDIEVRRVRGNVSLFRSS